MCKYEFGYLHGTTKFQLTHPMRGATPLTFLAVKSLWSIVIKRLKNRKNVAVIAVNRVGNPVNFKAFRKNSKHQFSPLVYFSVLSLLSSAKYGRIVFIAVTIAGCPSAVSVRSPIFPKTR